MRNLKLFFYVLFLCAFLVSPIYSLDLISPNYLYEFNGSNLGQSSWCSIPGGFTGQPDGAISFVDIPSFMLPTSQDRKGMRMTVDPGEIAFAYACTAVDSDGLPVIIRAKVQADELNVSVALATIRGNLSTWGDVDGSIATHIPKDYHQFSRPGTNLGSCV